MLSRERRQAAVVSRKGINSSSDQPPPSRLPTVEYENNQDLFRQFFERTFHSIENGSESGMRPNQYDGSRKEYDFLEDENSSSNDHDDLTSHDSESEWSGIHDEEEKEDGKMETVEVVEHLGSRLGKRGDLRSSTEDRRSWKAFMVSENPYLNLIFYLSIMKWRTIPLEKKKRNKIK